MKKAIWLIVIVLFLLLLVLFLQKSTEKSAEVQKHQQDHIIVTTIYPLYYFTKGIVGESIEVMRLIKPGNEIHSFAPTPADMVSLWEKSWSPGRKSWQVQRMSKHCHLRKA